MPAWNHQAGFFYVSIAIYLMALLPNKIDNTYNLYV